MKVWMLANGEAWDYSHVGFFSTREKAEHARAIRCNLADHDPEEFELDDPTLLADPEPGLEVGPVYRARLELESGRLLESGSVEGWYRDPERCRVEVDDDDYGVDAFSPISEEHAVEAAVAGRLAWLWEKGRLRIEIRGDDADVQVVP